ncbi:MAG: diacylglycerol kinase family protein [Acidobacteriaceae bacterium]
MKRVTLIYNPVSGGNRSRRLRQVEAAAAVFRGAGIEAEVVSTRAAGSAGEQARAAIAAGSDTIFACGGDGTLHDILQGMVGLDAVLGIIPLGTANALAYDLEIPFHAVRAARVQLAYKPRRIPVGTVEYARKDGKLERRYFTVMSGAGPDAAMVYALSAKWKDQYGLWGYLAKSAELFFTHHFAPFQTEFVNSATGQSRKGVAVSVMAVRITNFGNVLRKLAPGARLEQDCLSLVVIQKYARISFLFHLVTALFGYRGNIPGVEFAQTKAVFCTALPNHPVAAQRMVRAEADGEHLGRLPVRMAIEPAGFTLLMPPERSSDC